MTEFDQFYAAGQWRRVGGSDELPVISPYSEKTIATVHGASPADVDTAVNAAWQAMHGGEWSRATLADRCAMVERLRDGLVARRDELIEHAVATLGQPLSRARQVSAIGPRIDRDVDTIKALALEFQREDDSGVGLVERRPVGVVAGICPFNAPTLMEIKKTVPALLAGCAVVLKSDPQTPYASHILAEVVDQAGFPPGALNVVFGGGPTGDALIRHPRVSMVTFTGSAPTGAAIGAVCGGLFKRMVLELGGKSAAILLDDADFDSALNFLDIGNFRNAGQACIALTRIIAPRHRYDEVVEGLAAKARAYQLGDPFDEATTMGPVVTQRQQNRILGMLDGARAAGATFASGGGRPADLPHGWFVEPTVVAGLDNSAAIAQEELFGPVATVIAYDRVEDAVAIANDSKYGLHGAVFSTDEERALEVARQVESGTVGINCFGHVESSPFGGIKNSGVGREYGPENFDAFLEYTTYTLKIGAGSLTAPAPAVH